MVARFNFTFVLFLGMSFLLHTEAALATPKSGNMGLRPYIATEYYQWKESIPQKSDFLSESGSRYALGLAYSNFTNLRQGLLLEVDATVYNGSVAYDGNAFDLAEVAPELKPFKSSTRYLGNTIQLNSGYRFQFHQAEYFKAFDAKISFGSSYWERDIGGGTLSDGASVQGYLETYHVLYAKAGVGILLETRTHRHNIDAGIKLPLRTRETIDFSSLDTQVELQPRSAISYYVSWLIYPIVPQSSSFSLSFYFEQTRFRKSAVKEFSFTSNGQAYQSAIYQPDSKSTVMGLRAFWEF